MSGGGLQQRVCCKLAVAAKPVQWQPSIGVVMRIHWIRLLILLQFCILEQIAALAADFSGANLSGAHLTNADLRGSNLSGANLTGADLSRTDLTGTNVTLQPPDPTQMELDSARVPIRRLPKAHDEIVSPPPGY
jgi:hypothetical protein